MLRIKLPCTTSRTDRSRYRQYNHENMSKAYSAVINDRIDIRKAAKTFRVPVTTLHDRCRGRIDVTCNKSGPQTVLSKDEEAKLVAHIQAMAAYGYGYTRQDVTTIATDLASYLGKKWVNDKPFSLQWFYSFLKRWPALKVYKPRSLDIMRAKATSEETVTNYYNRLEAILDQYNLKDSPERIYNLDEKGLMENHKPPCVVGSSGQVLVAVTLSGSSTTTVIGCGNAIGNTIPPYFIFKGQRMREELLEGCLPGTAGTVSASGWSNSEIFKKYLSEHFVKYSINPTAEKPILIMYDGHKSHVSVSLGEWAKERHMILFVLPAHTSHLLQPMDVACFEPFEKIYCNIRHKYVREHATRGVDRHSICRLGSRAYAAALTPANLQSAIRKCGVYPFDRNVVDVVKFTPAQVFKRSCDKGAEADSSAISPTENISSFFSKIDDSIFCDPKPTKKRKMMSTIVAGRAITDDDVLEKMKIHEASHPPSKKKSLVATTALTSSVVPSTSGISKRLTVTANNESDSESDNDNEVCCQCHLFTPDEVGNCVSLVFVSWAQCTHPQCQHWVHLKYCTPVKVIRTHAEFWCPCHDNYEE